MALNDRQKEAVHYLSGPLLVLAGAGSGKTKVITEKILHLTSDGKLAGKHIFAVTFTNKAAREMKERVSQAQRAKEAGQVQISTFHTLGLKMLQRDGKELGYKKNITIYDADDTLGLIKQITHDDAKRADSPLPLLQSQISRWKNAMVVPQTALSQASDDAGYRAAIVYGEYQRLLKAYNAVDFDDLIALPVRLLSEHPDVRERWQNRVRYLLVDEYQDTNAAQYQLMKHLAGPQARFTVVGDDDQSIYAWRGARPENMRTLSDDYPQLMVIKLEQNYRSTSRILRAANQLIGNNPHVFEKRLWSDIGLGEPLRVLQAKDEEHEAHKVVSELLAHKFKARTRFSDYAVLYRSNHQSRLIEKAFRENNIPYRLSGGTSFFSYMEVRDFMAYLRLLVNDDDDAAFLRIINTPRREIGAQTIEKLAHYAQMRGISLFAACFELGLRQHLTDKACDKLSEFGDLIARFSDEAQRGNATACVKALLDATRYREWLVDQAPNPKAAERRLENVADLVSWIERIAERDLKDKNLASVVSHLMLMDILDRNQDEAQSDQVQLMTLHAAKGLEFAHVYIIGMEEELLPHRTSIDEDTIEEERRLAYVGITRARQTLTFTYAEKRRKQGEAVSCEPSRFLGELPEQDLAFERPGQPVDPVQRQEKGQAHLANLRGLLGTR